MNFNARFCNSCSHKVIKVTFEVLQGSVATYLMYDGKYEKSFIANYLLNPSIEL